MVMALTCDNVSFLWSRTNGWCSALSTMLWDYWIVVGLTCMTVDGSPGWEFNIKHQSLSQLRCSSILKHFLSRYCSQAWKHGQCIHHATTMPRENVNWCILLHFDRKIKTQCVYDGARNFYVAICCGYFGTVLSSQRNQSEGHIKES